MCSLQIHKSQSDFANRYLLVKERLNQLLVKDVVIEHIGSTAVPGVDGKGIIDVLIGTTNLENISKVKKVLINNGFYLGKSQKSNDYIFLASSNSETGLGDIHIHLTINGGDKFNNHILLRNYLLKHPTVANNYSNLKYELARDSGFDREKYKEAKNQTVERLIKESKKWADYEKS